MESLSSECLSCRSIGCFVFGSNLAGRHSKGASLHARHKHGAIYGQGIGLQGNSYGIPTKDGLIRVLPLSEIKKYVYEFIHFAIDNPNIRFFVSQIGCGLAGFAPYQIAPMFRNSPKNCHFDVAWFPILGYTVSYWN